MIKLLPRLALLLALLMGLALPALAVNQARNFAGGVTTDNLASANTLQFAQLTGIYFRFNMAVDEVGSHRYFAWSDGTTPLIDLITGGAGNVATIQVSSGVWSTGTGNWTIVAPSTGAEHDLLMTYDAGLTTNAPVVYLDGSSVTVTLVLAPTGTPTFTNAFKVTMGNRPDLTRAFNGWESTFAIWKGVTLTSTDATNLHNGQSPCATQTANLAFYAPVDQGDNPESELVTANNLTVTGTTVVSGSSTVKNPHCASFRTLMGVGQ